MSTTDTRAAFEAHYRKECGMPDGVAIQWDTPYIAAAWDGWQSALTWQAATEAAKATGTAGELFGYGSSEKKNCLLSKAQFDNCAPKNRAAYDIPLYAYSLPKCGRCKGYGVVTHISGQTPDNYEECNEVCRDCEGTGEAARQPAPVTLGDEDILMMASQHGVESREFSDECVISLVRAALAATNRSQP